MSYGQIMDSVRSGKSTAIDELHKLHAKLSEAVMVWQRISPEAMDLVSEMVLLAYLEGRETGRIETIKDPLSVIDDEAKDLDLENQPELKAIYIAARNEVQGVQKRGESWAKILTATN